MTNSTMTFISSAHRELSDIFNVTLEMLDPSQLTAATPAELADACRRYLARYEEFKALPPRPAGDNLMEKL